MQVIYELLALIEFTSARKRMSVLVKTKEGKILLLSKGADSVIMARLASDQKDPTIKAQEMIDEVSIENIVVYYSSKRRCSQPKLMHEQWAKCPQKNCTNKTNKNGQTWQACHHSKVVQRGPKGSEMINRDVFLLPIWHPFGPIWTLLDHFRQNSICCPIRTK